MCRLTLLLLLVSLFTRLGFAATAQCTPLLAEVSPSKSLYQLGLLVETKNHKIILGFNSYMGSGHKGISNKIEKDYGRITKFLWGGEIEFSIDPETQEIVISRFNQTSGFLNGTSSFQERILENDIRAIEDFSQIHLQDMISSSTKFESFSSDHPHLASSLATISQTAYLRHDILGSFMWIPIFISNLRKNSQLNWAKTPVDISFRKKMTNLRHQVSVIYDLVGAERFSTFNRSQFLKAIQTLSNEPRNPEAITYFSLRYNEFYHDLDSIFKDANVDGGLFSPIVVDSYLQKRE